MKEKIFVLGFNKVGTASFHHLFKYNGLNSRHHGSNNIHKNLALTIHRNLHSKSPILKGINHYDVYSDMVYLSNEFFVEANLYFEYIFNEYPNSYYILNTRPVEKWIASRKKHGRGGFLERYKKAFNIEENEAEKMWRQTFENQEKQMLAFFKDKPRSNFLHFNIEKDSPERIKDFLMDEIDLDISHWLNKNPTKHKK